MTDRSQIRLLIVFVDLTRYAAQALQTDDAVLADTIDTYYELVGGAVQAAGGTVVKFIGDAALAVFAESAVDDAVDVLLELKDEVDRLMVDRDWECRLTARAHVGAVMAGSFGERGAKRYDVIGSAVNAAARLESRGLTLSAEAFAALGPVLRGRFRHHAPSRTYVRAEDLLS